MGFGEAEILSTRGWLARVGGKMVAQVPEAIWVLGDKPDDESAVGGEEDVEDVEEERKSWRCRFQGNDITT